MGHPAADRAPCHAGPADPGHVQHRGQLLCGPILQRRSDRPVYHLPGAAHRHRHRGGDRRGRQHPDVPPGRSGKAPYGGPHRRNGHRAGPVQLGGVRPAQRPSDAALRPLLHRHPRCGGVHRHLRHDRLRGQHRRISGEQLEQGAPGPGQYAPAHGGSDRRRPHQHRAGPPSDLRTGPHPGAGGGRGGLRHGGRSGSGGGDRLLRIPQAPGPQAVSGLRGPDLPAGLPLHLHADALYRVHHGPEPDPGGLLRRGRHRPGPVLQGPVLLLHPSQRPSDLHRPPAELHLRQGDLLPLPAGGKGLHCAGHGVYAGGDRLL